VDPVLDDLSERLRGFVAFNPRVRRPHVEFLRREATELPQGADVLDVGAGIAPFRELFAHTRYVTCDWEESSYDEKVDIRAPADSIPVDDGSFDAVVCTEVLEHVPEPSVVLAELHRVLRPGGVLLVTVPLVWFLHEEPHDYYRYTPHGLKFLLDGAGFADLEIAPTGDAFSTLAELVANLGWMMGADQDPSDPHKAVIARAMRELGEVIGSFSGYDDLRIFPIGYTVKVRRPAEGQVTPGSDSDARSTTRRVVSRLARVAGPGRQKPPHGV
jgi:SAM-dependent methyltransferase